MSKNIKPGILCVVRGARHPENNGVIVTVLRKAAALEIEDDKFVLGAGHDSWWVRTEGSLLWWQSYSRDTRLTEAYRTAERFFGERYLVPLGDPEDFKHIDEKLEEPLCF